MGTTRLAWLAAVLALMSLSCRSGADLDTVETLTEGTAALDPCPRPEAPQAEDVFSPISEGDPAANGENADEIAAYVAFSEIHRSVDSALRSDSELSDVYYGTFTVSAINRTSRLMFSDDIDGEALAAVVDLYNRGDAAGVFEVCRVQYAVQELHAADAAVGASLETLADAGFVIANHRVQVLQNTVMVQISGDAPEGELDPSVIGALSGLEDPKILTVARQVSVNVDPVNLPD